MKETIKLIRLGQLVEDFALYPRRSGVDSGHCQQITTALKIGVRVPDLVVEENTWRIVDGHHRYRSYIKFHGEGWEKKEVRCLVRKYKNDSEFLLDAGRLNASHGRALTGYDKEHFVLLASNLKIDPALVASAINITVEQVTSCHITCATVGTTRIVTPLKQPIRHMAGKELTQEQADIIPRLGGNQQMFFVNQLLMLIGTKLIDTNNVELMKKLGLLRDEIDSFLGKNWSVDVSVDRVRRAMAEA